MFRLGRVGRGRVDATLVLLVLVILLLVGRTPVGRIMRTLGANVTQGFGGRRLVGVGRGAFVQRPARRRMGSGRSGGTHGSL